MNEERDRQFDAKTDSGATVHGDRSTAVGKGGVVVGGDVGGSINTGVTVNIFSMGVIDPGENFVGREDEIRQMAASVQEKHTNVIGIGGPAGIGKTQLARAVARSIANQFPDKGIEIDLKG
ncbi:MAG: hypothetical protein GY803_28040, partial [Chloroflexi bacterium]|nr:hypothetical protein [Chloroflexota bacterium]